VTQITLATGLAVRGIGDTRQVLLVASTYPNHPQPLWNLPGGRQQPGELLSETVAREALEETGLRVSVGGLAYLAESYDDGVHFLSAAFEVTIDGDAEPRAPATPGADHVVTAAWVPLDEIASRIVVGVVREPLLAYLNGELGQRYAGFHKAGITIKWPTNST
jgi:ADP-ribose pyrophosphatase YjhB (NUDIX family)